MSSPSEAHRLANHLFETFLGNNEALKSEELAAANVHKTEDINQEGFSRIEIEGEVDGKPVIQMLGKNSQGGFYLSTAFIGTKKGHVRHEIKPETESELLDKEPTQAVRQSFFMAKLVHFALTR